MVNLVSGNIQNVASQTALKNAERAKILVKYINNEVIHNESDSFTSQVGSAFKTAAAFQGIPMLLDAKKGIFKNQEVINLGTKNKQALDKLIHGTDKVGKRVLDYVKSANDNAKEYETIRHQLKESAKKTSKKASKKIAKEVTEKITQDTIKESTKLSSKIGQASSKIKNTASKPFKTAGNALNKATKGVSGKVGKALKSSGAKGMLIFSGVIETATEVIPTYKELGFKKGTKQLGKSAIKVVGDTAGYVIGAKAGTAIGTAIGTVVPGIGNVIGGALGGVIGFACGLIGSFAAGKLTKAITGGSEREIAKKEQEKQTAKEIANDEETMNQIKQMAMAKIQEDAMDDGQLTQDSAVAYKILEEMEMDSSNPFVG